MKNMFSYVDMSSEYKVKIPGCYFFAITQFTLTWTWNKLTSNMRCLSATCKYVLPGLLGNCRIRSSQYLI